MNELEKLGIKEEITFNNDVVTEGQLDEIVGTELRNNGYAAALRMTFRIEPIRAHLEQQARVFKVWAQEDPRKYDRVADTYMKLRMETGDSKYMPLAAEYREVARQALAIRKAKPSRQRLEPAVL